MTASRRQSGATGPPRGGLRSGPGVEPPGRLRAAPGEAGDSADAILIDGIEVRCALGVTAEERAQRRPVRIDLVLGADLDAACRSDDLSDTVDYGAVFARVEAVAGHGDHLLVEALGRRVIDDLFGNFEALSWIRIEVRKPNPLDGVLEWTGCRLTRQRGE